MQSICGGDNPFVGIKNDQVGIVANRNLPFVAQAGQTEALSQIPPQLLQETIEAAKNAMTSGVSAAYYVAGAVMIVASLMAVIVLRRAEASDADAPPAGPAM